MSKNKSLLKIKRTHALCAITLAVVLSAACSQQGFLPKSSTSGLDSSSGARAPSGGDITPIREGGLEVPPLWEKARSSSRAWSSHAAAVVEKYGSALMLGASDVKAFCPNYLSLSVTRKINFWVYLISAVVKYESGFNPASRMTEPGMGNDPVTKKPIESEGLMQLSYQDTLNYGFCNEFDWAKDQSLAATDPMKTILDPYKNLTCGIRILNHQIEKHDAISIETGIYWSVLKPTHKASLIKALTNSIPFCRM